MDQHTQGMKAAREYAQWHIGHANWADRIIHAYRNPEQAIADLREEKK